MPFQRRLAAIVILFLTLGGRDLGATRVAGRPTAGPARVTGVGPRVLLIYDLEGASFSGSGRDDLKEGRERLISDVDAVVRGLFDGGASSVDLFCYHGDGDPDLVPAARVDARAKVLRLGDQSFDIIDPDNLLVTRGNYNAIVLVGMHDKPLSGGYSPHTLGAGIAPIIDGLTRTESELIAFSFGTAGVPLIFVSGDDHLRRDLASPLPWIEFVTVKSAIAPDSAVAFPAERVGRALRAGASAALRRLDTMRTLGTSAPTRAGMVATYPRQFPRGLANLPGIEVRGDTATFSAPDYRAALRGFWGLLGVSSMDPYALQILRESPETNRVLSAAFTTMWSRSADFEKGTWKPKP